MPLREPIRGNLSQRKRFGQKETRLSECFNEKHTTSSADISYL